MAKKATTVTRKGQSVAVPTSRSEAAELLSRLGTLKRQADAAKTLFNKRLQAAADKAEAEVGPMISQSEAIMVALEKFAEAHREELLSDGARSFTLANGTAGWRDHPPKVHIKCTEKVLEHLQQLKLTKFIRTVSEIDKDAMLADQATAETIDGVSIGQGSTFFVRLPGDTHDITKGLKLKVPKVD